MKVLQETYQDEEKIIHILLGWMGEEARKTWEKEHSMKDAEYNLDYFWKFWDTKFFMHGEFLESVNISRHKYFRHEKRKGQTVKEWAAFCEGELAASSWGTHPLVIDAFRRAALVGGITDERYLKKLKEDWFNDMTYDQIMDTFIAKEKAIREEEARAAITKKSNPKPAQTAQVQQFKQRKPFHKKSNGSHSNQSQQQRQSNANTQGQNQQYSQSQQQTFQEEL